MTTWPLVELGEVFDIARGGSPRPIDAFLTEDPSGINWIMIGDAVDGSKYISSTKKRIRKEGVSRSRVVHPGDLLLTNSMSFGRPYILDTPGCIHDGWLVLSPQSQNIDPNFFYHLLGSSVIYEKFAQLAAGAVVKNLNINLVKSVKVALPPRSEQLRIAEILDRADAMRRKRKEANALTDELLRSVFLALFGDPVANPKRWVLKSVSDVCVSKQYGTAEKANSDSRGLPVLRMNNLTYAGDIDISDLKWVELDTKEAQKLDLRDGDLLFNRVNSHELVGKTAAWHEGPGFTFAGYLIRLRIRGDLATGDYVAAAMNMPSMKRRLMAMAKPSINMANISGSDLDRLILPIPPVAAQQRYSEIRRTVVGLRARYKADSETAEALFQSLVARAFSNQLTKGR